MFDYTLTISKCLQQSVVLFFIFVYVIQLIMQYFVYRDVTDSTYISRKTCGSSFVSITFDKRDGIPNNVELCVTSNKHKYIHTYMTNMYIRS